jgi:hypothetical protein
MIKLTIEETRAEQFLWRLVETDDSGRNARTIDSAREPAESYELALSSGQLALNSNIRKAHEAHG